ncbi:MAG: aconitate hydratase AcnA [Terriglobales bacterium]|jgi:aconitate hydratase
MRLACEPSNLGRLTVDGETYAFVELGKVVAGSDSERLPYCIRILLENVARCSPEALSSCVARALHGGPACEVPFYPNRLMLHDTTCLPAIADLAALRDVVAEMGGNPEAVNPVIPSVLTIDHSVIVERYANPHAVEDNLEIDFRRNAERYRFIKWAQQSLENLRVIPPGTGIIHQMNTEVIAEVVVEANTDSGMKLLHPDDMVATDSHTPMINSIGILGWGVGGLEGQAAMMGEPVSIRFPEVVGVRLTNELRPGISATDLALHITELLRRQGVVGKFVEFCGPGLNKLGWGDRGTVANMAPEYGATVVFFPFDDITLEYLRLTGRCAAHLKRVTAYMTAQGLWRRGNSPEPSFDQMIDLDLSVVRSSMSGPSQPHQRRDLSAVAKSFQQEAMRDLPDRSSNPNIFVCPEFGEPIRHGAVVIAAITSCTNTANPTAMMQAGLLARNARQRGLRPKPWVKTSLSPGSRVVADYLGDSGLLEDLAALGFDLTGFGCMTCIGGSGPLEPHVQEFCKQGLRAVAVLSGNRNFEGRVHPSVGAGYLASPALVVAYAITGTINIDIEHAPLGIDRFGKETRLRDILPSDGEVQALISKYVKPDLFQNRKKTLWDGTSEWQTISAPRSTRFCWDAQSTYIRRPQYLGSIERDAAESLAVRNARILLVLGDNVTTDHMSPAGAIPPDSLAGRYLIEHGESPADLNQYSTRRSNHEVMLRGAFTNRAVVNLMLGDKQPEEGAWTYTADRSTVVPVYEAAPTYAALGIPLVIVAGRNYGAGSSRDWAAKVQALLGVKVVIARSLERIHRSNLIGTGIFPMEFVSAEGLGDQLPTGEETLSFDGLDAIRVGENPIALRMSNQVIPLLLRIDSRQELQYLRNGGILPYVARKVVSADDRIRRLMS